MTTSLDVSRYRSRRAICVANSRRVCCDRVCIVTVCVSREYPTGLPSHLLDRSTAVCELQRDITHRGGVRLRVTGWHCGTLTLRVRPQHTVHCPSHGARPSASPGIVIHDVRTLVPKAAEVRLSFEVVTNDLDQHGVAHRSVVCSHATHSRRHTFVTATAAAAMHSKI